MVYAITKKISTGGSHRHVLFQNVVYRIVCRIQMPYVVWCVVSYLVRRSQKHDIQQLIHVRRTTMLCDLRHFIVQMSWYFHVPFNFCLKYISWRSTYEQTHESIWRHLSLNVARLSSVYRCSCWLLVKYIKWNILAHRLQMACPMIQFNLHTVCCRWAIIFITSTSKIYENLLIARQLNDIMFYFVIWSLVWQVSRYK